MHYMLETKMASNHTLETEKSSMETTGNIGESPELEKLNSKFSKYENVIAESALFTETMHELEACSITHVRCLALGSPSDSNAALYQLAFLMVVCDHFKIPPKNVSLYDPVFNELDNKFLASLEVGISEEDPFIGFTALYFLPHASLELTEQVLDESKPLWLLGNDIITHTDRLTKKKLHDTYRTISLLTKLLEPSAVVQKENDDFISVSSKRKKKSNKKAVFKEPEIDYDYNKCYFDKVVLKRMKETQGVWANSFTDLAFHLITSKDTETKVTK